MAEANVHRRDAEVFVDKAGRVCRRTTRHLFEEETVVLAGAGTSGWGATVLDRCIHAKRLVPCGRGEDVALADDVGRVRLAVERHFRKERS